MPPLTDSFRMRSASFAATARPELPGPRCRSNFAQRSLDVVVCMVAFVVAAPVIALAMLAVKCTSRGPALYTQVRLGRFGLPFQIYKIRSMRSDSEKDGAQWCRKGDSRVTRIGAFLRVTHIDELPQIWNILCGQMSLVGPRPERPEFVVALAEALPRYRQRLSVRPGLTGLAQVQLPPDTDLESVRRKLLYDLHYIEAGTAWMDLRLIVATLFHVLKFPFGLSKVLLGLPGKPEVETKQQHPVLNGRHTH